VVWLDSPAHTQPQVDVDLTEQFDHRTIFSNQHTGRTPGICLGSGEEIGEHIPPVGESPAKHWKLFGNPRQQQGRHSPLVLRDQHKKNQSALFPCEL
jgi:hypothetical protein